MTPEDLRIHVEATLKGACELLGTLKVEGARIRERSKESYGEVLEAHALMTGTLHSALMRQNAKPGKTSEATSKRLLLLASFIQGIDLCETSISEGFYLQAAALLKQELETIAAIEEVKAGRRQDGRTPNVAYAPWSLGQLYGALNDAAHVGKGEVLQAVLGLVPEGEAKAVAMTPQFSEENARRLFSLHVALLTWACWELDCLHRELYGEGLTPQESETLLVALRALQSDGVLGLPEAADAQQNAGADAAKPRGSA